MFFYSQHRLPLLDIFFTGSSLAALVGSFTKKSAGGGREGGEGAPAEDGTFFLVQFLEAAKRGWNYSRVWWIEVAVAGHRLPRFFSKAPHENIRLS